MSDSSKLIVDVGGTKTTLNFHDPRKSRPFKKVFPSDAEKLISRIEAMLKNKGEKPRFVIAGIRGVWMEAEKKNWREKFRHIGEKVIIMSDIELAFLQHFGHGGGIILNAGTGSIAYGKTPLGCSARAGGVGPLLGDKGSAFWIGKEYLSSFAGRQGWRDVRQYAVGRDPVSKVAGLARVALKKAEKGNKECLRIIDRAQEELLSLIVVVKRELKEKTVSLKLAGGLFDNKFFRRRFEKKLHPSFHLQN